LRFDSLITCSFLQQATILIYCLKIGVHYRTSQLDAFACLCIRFVLLPWKRSDYEIETEHLWFYYK
jgi:hypothetical protein